jgi:hypothetical protein
MLSARRLSDGDPGARREQRPPRKLRDKRRTSAGSLRRPSASTRGWLPREVSAHLAAFDLADRGLSPASQRALLIATWVSWVVFVVHITGTAPRRAFPPARASLAAIGSPCSCSSSRRCGAALWGAAARRPALLAARVPSTPYRAAGVARQPRRSRTSYLARWAASPRSP